MGSRALRVFRVYRVTLDPQDHRVRRVIPDLRDHREYKVIRGPQDRKEYRVIRDLRAIRVSMDSRV